MKKQTIAIIIILIIMGLAFNVKNVKASNDIVVNVDYNGEWVKSQIDKNSKLIEYVETNILPAIEEKGYKYGMFINAQGIAITFLEEDTKEVNFRPAFWGDSANNKIEGKPDDTKNKTIYYTLADYEKGEVWDKEVFFNWYDKNDFFANNFWYRFGLGSGYYGNKKVTESFNLYDDTFKNNNNSEDYMASTRILYKSNVKVKIMKGDAYLPLRINKGEILNEGEEFPTYKAATTPRISFSYTNIKETIDEKEYVVGKNVTIDFGYIDNSKYLYLVSLDNGKNWTSYSLTKSTSVKIKVYDNINIIAKVLKIENNEYVTGASFTIGGIENAKVTIKFYKYDNPNCEANYLNKKTEVCNDLDIIFNYINFDKYKYQYSIDKGKNFIDITKTEDNKFNYVLHNEYLIVKVVDKNSNEIVASASYTFGKYNDIPKEPFVNFEIYYNFTSCDSTNTLCDTFKLVSPREYQKLKKNNLIHLKDVSATLGVQVFNYKENYHYYFSDNSNIYKNHEIKDFKKSEFGYYYSAIETDFNMTIVIDIYNENNEYVGSYSFTIAELPKKQEDIFSPTDILDYFKNISNNNNNLFYYINEVYKRLRNSKLGGYILIIFVSSFIILLIKSVKKN